MNSPIYIKWQTKLHNIESNNSIQVLRRNYNNYYNAIRKKTSPNPFSRSDYNLYNKYLKIKKKISKHQARISTTKLPPIKSAKTVTPDDSSTTSHRRQSMNNSSNSEVCKCCIGKIWSFKISNHSFVRKPNHHSWNCIFT
jgi:hypothetical protein